MTIPWADSFREMMNFFKVITIDLSDIFATLNFSSGFYAYMALLPALSMVASLAGLTLRLCTKKNYYPSVIKIILTMMFLLYPSIGGKIFSIFRCMSVGEKLYFVKSMEMECYAVQHASLVALAVVFIALYVLGIPLYMYFLLRKNKDKLDQKTTLDL